MIALGSLSFASPWILLAALGLPAIWLLLRMTPPAVTRVIFPAVRLMFDLGPTERTPARTPWWLVALRMFIAALVIFALAEPVLNAQKFNGEGPLIVVLDNGWGAARHWPERLAAARDIVESADLRRRPVMLIPTAARTKAEGAPALALTDAREVLGELAQIQPRAWASDVAALLPKLRLLSIPHAEVFWISDGVAVPQTEVFAQTLQNLGTLKIIRSPPADAPLVLSQPQRSSSDKGTVKIDVRMKRIAPASSRVPMSVTLHARDAAGEALAQADAAFTEGNDTLSATLTAPIELANRIARFEIANHASAAATALSDDRWQQRPVGIFSAAVSGGTAPLLDDGYYLTQALQESAEVRVGTVRELLSRPLSMLIVSGGQKLTEEEQKAVSVWVENGGLLVRFAGPRLDPAGDVLLPVKLREAGRNLGGALSWGEPAGLGPFPDKSPFKLLPIPEDITVSTQILAEPSADLPDKTWAKLADGTPLITAERRGAGRIVLFHVTPTPEWSNLPLSGLFIGMLRTLLDLSQGVTSDELETPPLLPPIALLDGLGRAQPPGPTSAALPSGKIETITPGPDAPPGLYGTPRNKYALNLGAGVWASSAVEFWPAGVSTVPLDALKGERDLKPWVLLTALLLLLFDFALSYHLRGLLPGLPKFLIRTVASALIAVCALTAKLHAQEMQNEKPLDPDIVNAVLQTRLAYISTGSSDLDRLAEAGLSTLTRVLASRTSAEMAEPAAIRLSAATTSDMLMPYPLVYWRVTANQPVPPDAALSAINAYFRHGGMFVIDAPNQVGAIGGNADPGGKLREILARIDTPPLMPLSNDHVLTRSFYLTQGLPGRYANGVVYVERGSSANDGVSSVIIGGQDWAAAWARDASGLPLYPVVPGGERQRELAYRAGVNMVMYALTGNYKADQVHVPAIIQRLTQ